MAPVSPSTSLHSRARRIRAGLRVLATMAATIGACVLPSGAEAAMAIDSGPRIAVNPYQVTIWWHSSSTGSSELRWDTSNKGTFSSFANDASNAATNLGTLHSRTISNLSSGTYWYRVRTTGAAGTVTSAARSFTVTPPSAATPLGTAVVDGTVYDVETSATRVYVGGSFERMGTRAGSGIRVDPTTASASAGQGAPQVAGAVTAAIDAPDGSRYVGGQFTHVGGLARGRIARLLPDGGVDPYFATGGGFNGNVEALAISGTRLYVGGAFTTYDSTARNRITALDAASGALDTTFVPPGTGFNGTVNALHLNGARLYASGSFTTYNGAGRTRLAALDATTAVLDTGFAPGAGLDTTAAALAVANGKLYAAGSFTTYQGSGRRGVVAMDPDTATIDTTFNPGTGHNINGVSSLVVGPARVYVGGSFSTFNGAARNGLVALDPATAAVDTTFNATNQLNANGWVYDMALVGTKLYIAGRFTTYAGAARASIAAVDATSAALDMTFDPGTGFGQMGDVSTLSHGSVTGSLFVGGWFGTYQATVRSGLGAINVTTGTVDATFNPASSLYQVEELLLNGSTLYVGGQFTTYQGFSRNNIVAVNATTAAIDGTFNPGTGANSAVRALALSGTKLYLGGAFTTYNGAARNYVAAVNATNGAVDATFNPGVGFDNFVEALTVNGTRLYVGGWFSTYAGTSRVRIAALDTTTAALDGGFNPGTGFNSYVFSLATTGARVYAAGQFTTYNGAGHNRIVALDTATAAPVAGFATGTGFNGIVREIELSGTWLVAAGSFSTYQGTSRVDLAAIDATTATLVTDVDPGPTPSDNAFNAVSVTGTLVAAGGSLDSANGVATSGVAIFSVGNPADRGTLTLTQQPQHWVNPHQTTVAWSTSVSSSSELVWDRSSRSGWYQYANSASNAATGLGTAHSRTISNLPAGTYYYRVRSRTAGGEQVTSAEQSFVVATPDAATPLGSTVVDGSVHALAEAGDRLYLGGSFTSIGTRLGGGIQLDAVNASLRATSGLPQLTGALRVSIPDGSGGWYVGGSFTRVGGLDRRYIAHILPDGGVDPAFNVGTGPDRFVGALALSGGKLYIGGFFTTINGTSRNYIAALDATTGALDTTFNPGTAFDDQVRDILVSGGKVYVGGSFTTYQGLPHSGIVALNPTTAAVDPTFNAGTGTGGASHSVWGLDVRGANLYMGGFFTSYNGTPRARVAAVALATGALDATFDPGVGFAGGVRSIAILGTRLYAAGNFTAYGASSRNRIAAIDTTNAALDMGFNPGTGFDNITNDVATDGTRIYYAGSYTTYNGTGRARITAVHPTTAAIDATFDPGTGFEQQVLSIAASGGVVVTGGISATYRGITRNRLAALDRISGELDTTFDPGAGPNADVYALATDGTRLYLGGAFTSYAGTGRNRIAAANPTSGALDAAFNPGTGADAPVRAMLVSGARLYAGGEFTTYNGTGRNRIVGITAATGALDAAFNPGTGADNVVHALTLQGTRLYLGGEFGTYNGAARVRVAAVTAASGAIDPGFTTGAGADATVYALASDASRVYLGGAFTTYGAATRSKFAAVNPATGAVDATFDTSAATAGQVRSLALVGNLLVVGGTFNSVLGTPRFRVAAVAASTAVLDPQLTFGIGAVESAATPSASALLVSGSRLVVGGDFAVFNDVAQGRLAMLDVCDRVVFCPDEQLRDYVSLSVSATTVALGSVVADGSAVGTVDALVQSNAFNGYALTATDASDTVAASCTATCGAATIADWAPAAGAPSPWPETAGNYGFGVTVLSSTHQPKDAVTWGSGTTPQDFAANRYRGLDASTGQLLHRTNRFVGTSVDTTRLGLRVRTGPTQAPGSYAGAITLTVVANP